MPHPILTLKLATSLDGRIALAHGESRWITGEAARKTAHALRAAHDAVLIGSGTALADNPRLNVRDIDPLPATQPARLVLDTRLRLPIDAQLYQSAHLGQTICACSMEADHDKIRALEACGVEVWTLPLSKHGPYLCLDALLDRAEKAKFGSILIEGGAQIAASFMRSHPPARIEWFRAPVLIGADGVAAIGPLGLQTLQHMPRYRRLSIQNLDADILESLERIG